MRQEKDHRSRKAGRWDLIRTLFSPFLADESANRCLHHPANFHPSLIIQTGYNSRFKRGRSNWCETKVKFESSSSTSHVSDRCALPAQRAIECTRSTHRVSNHRERRNINGKLPKWQS